MGLSITILYASAIVGLRKNFSNLLVFGLGSLFFISILLTGGRTAMVTFVLMNVFIFHRQLKRRLLLVIPIFIALGFVLIYYVSLLQFRAFSNASLFGGKEASGSIKLQIFLSYLQEYTFDNLNDIISLIFGRLNWDRMFDEDPGYIISFFGIAGFIVIAIFFYQVYKMTYKSNRFVFSLFLISIGGTVLINYKFSILLFIVLSSGYRKYILERNDENTLAGTVS